MPEVITDNIELWTSALLTKSTAGRGSNGKVEAYGIKKLRELILELAVRGKLVLQDPNDEPASALIEKMAESQARLIKDGVIKKQSQLAKIEDDEIPFDVPEGWLWLRLGELGYTQTGGTPSKTNPANFGDDIPFIKPGDIYPNYVDYSNEGLSCEGQLELGRTALANSILMVCIGTIGKCNSIDRPCAFNQQINSITPYIPMTEYLLKAINSNYFQTEAWQQSSSTTIAILNKGKWNDIIVPIPPIKEQHRIVAKVDELMALCDKLEQQQTNNIEAHQTLVETLLGTLTNVESQEEFTEAWTRIANHFDTLFTSEQSIDQLKQTILQLAVMGKLVPQDLDDEPASVLLERVAKQQVLTIGSTVITLKIENEEKLFNLPTGWTWTRGEVVADFIDPHPSHRTPPECQGGVPYVGYTDIDHKKGIDFENSRKVDPKVFEEHQIRYQLKSGDFVFGKIGTLGEPFFLQEPFNYCLSANLILIQPKLSTINPKYLAVFLDSPKFVDVMGDQKTNSTHGVFGIKKARLICLPLPPLPEQHRIVAKVNELMSLCDALKARLAASQTTQIHLADNIVEQAVA